MLQGLLHASITCVKECTLSFRTLLWISSQGEKHVNIIVHGSVLGGGWVSTFGHYKNFTLAWSWCEGPRLIFGSTKFGIYLPCIETGTARPWMQLVLPQVPVRQVLV